MITLFLFDFCVWVLTPGRNALSTYREKKRRGDLKCLWWFLIIWKLNEIKFITSFFLLIAQKIFYDLSYMSVFFCLFLFFTQKNVTQNFKSFFFSLEDCKWIFVVFKIRLMCLRQAGFVNKDVAAVI